MGSLFHVLSIPENAITRTKQRQSSQLQENGSDYRIRITAGRYLPGASGNIRRYSNHIWCQEKDPGSQESQKSGRYRKLHGGASDMIKVNSTVKLNFPKINQLTRAQVAALEQTAEGLHTEVEQAQVFPRDTGALQNESTFVDTSESSHGKASIISSTPYARRLYFHPEFHFKKDENPNAKGKWYEDWLPGGKNADFAVKAFKENYRRLAGL